MMVRKRIKKVILLISILPLYGCTSLVNKDSRVPNAASEPVIRQGVDVVETSHGRLSIEWEDKSGESHGDGHVLSYSPVEIKVYLTCSGHEERQLIMTESVCFYDGYEHKDKSTSTVSIGYLKQLKPVAEVTASNQLRVIPENDQLCNSKLDQDIPIASLCPTQ